MLGLGTATQIVSNKEIKNIMKVVRPLEDFEILIKWATKTIENKTKNKRVDFLVSSPPHSLTNFAKSYQNKSKFKGVYWQISLPNTQKNETYVVQSIILTSANR